MRDYPSIPSVFRVNTASSTNSINNLNASSSASNGGGHSSSMVQSIASSMGDGGNGVGTSGRVKKTENDLASVGIELNYHNGKSSSEYLLGRNSTAAGSSSFNRHVPIVGGNNLNFITNNSQSRSDGDGGAINSISGSLPPPASASVSGTFPGKFTEGSDLNISVNSFTDISNIPSCSRVATTSRHYDYAAAAAGVGDGTALSQRRFSSGDRNSGYFLWIMTPVAASFSVAIVIAALAGPQWLYAEEKLPNANYNGTANFNAQDDGAYITKYTKSSLWILCTALQGVETYNCIKIDYFPKEGYQPDPHDSTPAIPYTITKSCPFFLASGIFLLISFIVFLVPTCSHRNYLYYFSSGIMFIVSGLFMLIGLIAYISILKAEIGSKLRPRSTLQPALFKVTYGQSFFLYVFGFISTEFVGVLNIFLYISLQEVGYYSKLPCLSFTNIQEKIKEGENRSSKSHPHRRKEKLEVAGYNCKKHPSKVFNDMEKRYYFEKPPKCDLHSKNIAKSLNELYTEPAPPPFHLPTLDIHYQQQQQHQQLECAPLTRSVSTATEIYPNGASGNPVQQTNNSNHYQNNNSNGGNNNINGNGNGSERRITSTSSNTGTKKHQGTLTSKPHQREMMVRRDDEADNASIGSENGARGSRMRRGSSSTGINDICGLSRGIRKTKDEFFNEFCKRAGVRPKPKDIYFIDGNCDDPDDDENIYIVDNTKSRQLQPSRHHQPASVYYPGYRRNSMFVGPPPPPPTSNSLRKQNSNLSLHVDSKLYQKSLFDLDRCESEIWNTYPEQNYAKGSGKQLQDCNVYQSRTLPRSFMKRNFDSQESLLMSAMPGGVGGSQSRLSVTGHNHYPTAQSSGARLSHGTREPSDIYHSGLTLHKSCEDVRNTMGAAVTRKPSATLMAPPTVQWPATIPTSPSNFSTNSFLYGNQHSHPAMVVAGRQGSTASNGNAAHHKFARAYAFDDRRADGAAYDAFDLDEIERERRRSHANLFDGRYDVINGTAV